MSYLLALVLPVLPVVLGQSWSYKPDKTYDWYRERKLPLPKLASEHSTESTPWGESQIFKLDCLGCPFRVRKYRVKETWQTPAQDNSLMLNFTIPTDHNTLLLNGETILPLGSRPPSSHAFQIPANTSQEIMDKMVGEHMLDESWRIGTKYARFELQYNHTRMPTKRPGQEWLQFDVTGVLLRYDADPRSYLLNQEGQKLVQLLLEHKMVGQKPVLAFTDAQLVERNKRQQPLKMECGKLAMVQTEYNPLEWDGYGKLGTWSHYWHEFWDQNAHLFLVFGVVFVSVYGATSLVLVVIKRMQARAASRKDEDPEAAALVGDCDVTFPDDAPPEYADVPALAEQKPEEKQ